MLKAFTAQVLKQSKHAQLPISSVDCTHRDANDSYSDYNHDQNLRAGVCYCQQLLSSIDLYRKVPLIIIALLL